MVRGSNGNQVIFYAMRSEGVSPQETDFCTKPSTVSVLGF